MKKITANPFRMQLLVSMLAIFLLGSSSRVAAQDTSSNETQFSWFLSLIGSRDTTQIFCVDEDNGSTIEAEVGQTISVMFNYPRISTAEEKLWEEDPTAKQGAWSYSEDSDQWSGWTYWAQKIPLLKENNTMKGYIPFTLIKSQYPNDDMHRLTDSDFTISNEMGNQLYPRWAHYDTFIATHEGTTTVTFQCKRDKKVVKTVTLTFHITHG